MSRPVSAGLLFTPPRAPAIPPRRKACSVSRGPLCSGYFLLVSPFELPSCELGTALLSSLCAQLSSVAPRLAFSHPLLFSRPPSVTVVGRFFVSSPPAFRLGVLVLAQFVWRGFPLRR